MEGIQMNFSVLLMLLIVVTLFAVNTIEIINLISTWKKTLYSNPILFEQCIKFPLIMKSFFVVFSILATFSVFILFFGIIINAEFFYNRIRKSYLHFNFMVFGPGVTICGLMAFWNFSDFTYTCEFRHTLVKSYNISNI